MADNVPITAGSGTSIRTDLVGPDHYQVIKLDGGDDGVSIPIVAGQKAMAASLPVVVASDQGAMPTSDSGAAWAGAYTVTASADATGVVDVTVAPAAGQKIVIDDIIVSVDTAMKVTFEEETSHTDIIALYMPANSVVQVTPRGKIKLSTADKKLQIYTSLAGNIAVTVCYHSEE